MWEYKNPYSSEFRLSTQLFERYDQIAIFVQSRIDLDSCCCAIALCELISNKWPNKTISLINIRCSSRLLAKDLRKYKEVPIDVSKGFIAVFSEISGVRELNKAQIELANKAEKLIIIDHHDNENRQEHEKLKEAITVDEVHVLHEPLQTSSCEVL